MNIPKEDDGSDSDVSLLDDVSLSRNRREHNHAGLTTEERPRRGSISS